MATINEGNGRYKANIAEVCERINKYKEQNPTHVIVVRTNPYNQLVAKLYDKTNDLLIMVVEYLTENTIDQVTACADEHHDGRFW